MKWTLPIELVKLLATGNGAVFLLRAQAEGAAFEREVQVFERGGHFVAEVTFVRPVLEKLAVTIQLRGVPQADRIAA
jgi:hypothetical protein